MYQNDLEGMLKRIEDVIDFINEYESSLPSAQAFTKLKESTYWLQVMVNHVDKAKVNEETGLISDDQC